MRDEDDGGACGTQILRARDFHLLLLGAGKITGRENRIDVRADAVQCYARLARHRLAVDENRTAWLVAQRQVPGHAQRRDEAGSW